MLQNFTTCYKCFQLNSNLQNFDMIKNLLFRCTKCKSLQHATKLYKIPQNFTTCFMFFHLYSMVQNVDMLKTLPLHKILQNLSTYNKTFYLSNKLQNFTTSYSIEKFCSGVFYCLLYNMCTMS